MPDLGSDAAGSALSLGTKALEAILRLFEKLFEAWKNNPERKLAKVKLKDAKNEHEKRMLLEKMTGTYGYVNYQDLKRSGLELTPIGVFMTKTEMTEFSALCKREGVLFSGMTDVTALNKDGVKTYELICPTKDLVKVKGIIDRLNVEKMIAAKEERIAELEAKGEDMTEQDKADVFILRKEITALQKGYCDKMNDEVAEIVIDKAVTGESEKTLTLDEALNRLTGRHIDKDVTTIVADANDPSKYIKCHGYQDEYNGKAYIKTEYEVFRDGKSVFKTHDGRFDGRPEGYWNQQKEDIQKAGGFSGTFLKFYSIADYQKWAEAARSQNAQELTFMDKDGEKNYADIIKGLEAQLDKNGARMNEDNLVVDKETGAMLAMVKGENPEQSALIAESVVIGNQINNYKLLSQLEAELAIAKANVLTAPEGSEEKALAEGELVQVQSKFDAAVTREKELLVERKEINAVQAEIELRNAPEQEKDISMENAEHPDDRRDDRINDKGAKQATMEEYKAEIEQEKAAEAKQSAALGNHMQAQEAKGVQAPVKAAKSSERSR